MTRLVALIGILAAATASTAFAQSLAPAPSGNSDIILSWRSNALSPTGYEGRVASPVGGSVLFLADALVNGQSVNLRGYEVRWYVDGELYDSGMGMFSTVYVVPDYPNETIDVRVEIVDAPFAAAEGSMTVPFADPQVVIEAPLGNRLRIGETVYTATPYSFNAASADDLIYTWTVDGNYPDISENPRELRLEVQGEVYDSLTLAVAAENPGDSTEGAVGNLTLGPTQ